MNTYPRIKRLKSKTRVEKRHRHGLPYTGPFCFYPFYFYTRGTPLGTQQCGGDAVSTLPVVTS
jgi:hypothetical protein